VTVSFSKQFVYFKKCMSVFIMRGILVAYYVFSGNDMVLANKLTIIESGDLVLHKRLQVFNTFRG
jgi:hypothetical protein